MNESLVTPRRVLVALSIAALLAGFVPTQGDSLPVRLVNRVVVGASRAVDFSLSPVTYLWRSGALALRPASTAPVVEQVDTDRLLDYYAQALVSNERLRQENARLREEVAYLRQSRTVIGGRGVSLLPASVTASGVSGSVPVLTLDRGRASGVQPGLAVEHRSSLVGVVMEPYLGERTCRVQLIAVDDQRLMVRIAPATPTGPPYVVHDTVAYDEDLEAFTLAVPLASQVQVGDIAHLADDRWSPHAQGLIVGKVAEIQAYGDDPLNFRSVVIRPMASLRSLKAVSVLMPAQAPSQQGGQP